MRSLQEKVDRQAGQPARATRSAGPHAQHMIEIARKGGLERSKDLAAMAAMGVKGRRSQLERGGTS